MQIIWPLIGESRDLPHLRSAPRFSLLLNSRRTSKAAQSARGQLWLGEEWRQRAAEESGGLLARPTFPAKRAPGSPLRIRPSLSNFSYSDS